MDIGDVVRSLKGRDKGRLFLVVGESVGRVLVVDGRVRPLERPKNKNLRHVAKVGEIPETLRGHLREGHRPTDAEVRQMIENLQEGGDANAEG